MHCTNSAIFFILLTMTTFTYTVTSYIKYSKNLQAILAKAKIWKDEKGYTDAQVLGLHLAVDQFPLVKQVQLVSDFAKKGSANLCGKENPSFADTETTIDELIERLQKTINFLETLKEEDVISNEILEKEMVALPWFPGKGLTKRYHLEEYAPQQFYFHYVTAYAILRNFGLSIGKGDFLGSVDLRDLV